MPVRLGSAFGQIDIDTSGVRRAEKESKKSLSSIERGFGGLRTAAKAAGAAVATAGALILGAMAKVGADGVKKAANLEAQLDGIQAVMGATDSQVQKLSDHILDLGLDPNLKVNSEEAANAIQLLARNGLKADEVLNGAAKSTVLLANATKAEFGTAADIATDSMAIFNIKAEDMMGAVNGITSVVNNSKFGIEDYQLALAQGGGVAASVGVEFEDFNTALAGTAPLFKSGSDAGTSMKTMLQRLVPASNKASDKMRALGIITEEGNNRFFDANGNMKSMAEVAGVLQDSLSGLSEEQRNQALSVIFGTDAMRSAVGMAKLGEKGFRDLQAQMGKTDALESAKTRMDNLHGALEILQGVFETIKIRIGQAFIPVLTTLARTVAAFLEQNADQFVAVFEAIGALMSMVTQHSVGLTSVVLRLANAFGISSSTAIAVIQALQQVRSMVQQFMTQATAVLAPVMEMVSQFVSWQDVLVAVGLVVASVVVPALVSVVAAIAPVIAAGAALVLAVAALRNAWESNFLGIRDRTQQVFAFVQAFIPQVMTFVRQFLMRTLTFLQNFWIQHGATIMATVLKMWNMLRNTTISVATNVRNFIITTLNNLQAFWNQHGAEVMYIVRGMWNIIRSVTSTILNAVVSLITFNLAALQQHWQNHSDTVRTLLKKAWDAIKLLVETALTIITSIISAFIAATQGDWRKFGEEIRDIWDAEWKLIASILRTAKDILIGLWDLAKQEMIRRAEQTTTGIKSAFDIDWGAVGHGIADGIADGISAGADAIKDAARAAARAALEAAKGFLGIDSPSKVFAEAVGRPSMQGMALGMLRNAHLPQQAVQQAARSSVRQVDNRTYIDLTAQYRHQDRASLTEDVKMLRMLTAGG